MAEAPKSKIWLFPGVIVTDELVAADPLSTSASYYDSIHLKFLNASRLNKQNVFGNPVNTVTQPNTTEADNGSAYRDLYYDHGQGGHITMTGYRVNGTPSAPTKVLSGDILAAYTGSGYDGTGAFGTEHPGMYVKASANWDGTIHDSKIDFKLSGLSGYGVTTGATIDGGGINVAANVNSVSGALLRLLPNGAASTGIVITSAGKVLAKNLPGVGPPNPNETSEFGHKFEVADGTAVSLFHSTAQAVPSTDLWNDATSGNNAFINFATEGTHTSRGSVTYNRGAGLTAYNTTSDARYKKNIEDSDEALPVIEQLQVRQYKWKDSDAEVRFGFVAQELNKIAPEAVSVGDAHPTTPTQTWGVDNSILVPMLIKAVQELTERIKQLESKNG